VLEILLYREDQDSENIVMEIPTDNSHFNRIQEIEKGKEVEKSMRKEDSGNPFSYVYLSARLSFEISRMSFKVIE
jgi:hypothetical protein